MKSFDFDVPLNIHSNRSQRVSSESGKVDTDDNIHLRNLVIQLDVGFNAFKV